MENTIFPRGKWEFDQFNALKVSFFQEKQDDFIGNDNEMSGLNVIFTLRKWWEESVNVLLVYKIRIKTWIMENF